MGVCHAVDHVTGIHVTFEMRGNTLPIGSRERTAWKSSQSRVMPKTCQSQRESSGGSMRGKLRRLESFWPQRISSASTTTGSSNSKKNTPEAEQKSER